MATIRCNATQEVKRLLVHTTLTMTIRGYPRGVERVKLLSFRTINYKESLCEHRINTNEISEVGKVGSIIIVAWIALMLIWPYNSVPTGSRGVVTQFGRIIGIESEGLVLLPPWQKLSIFSIRSEVATIDNASGATSDIQPVTVSLTVRYSMARFAGRGRIL